MFWGAPVTLRAPVESHRHDVYEFILALADGGAVGYGDRLFRIVAGQTVFVPAGIEHRIVASEVEPVSVQFICVDRPTLETALPAKAMAVLNDLDGGGPSIAQYTSGGDRVRSAVDLLQQELSANGPHGDVVAGGLFAALLALHAQACDWRADAIKFRTAPHMQQTKQWLAANIDKKISIDSLAAAVGMSRSVFQRAFKKDTGKTVVEYCTDLRLKNAERQLMRSNQTIATISYASGFNNLSHFHRIFRRTYGVTPQVYRTMRQPEA